MPIYHDPKSSFNHGLSIYGAEKILVIDSENKLQIVLGSPKDFKEIKEALNKVQ